MCSVLIFKVHVGESGKMGMATDVLIFSETRFKADAKQTPKVIEDIIGTPRSYASELHAVQWRTKNTV